jgi:hypothetical protein
VGLPPGKARLRRQIESTKRRLPQQARQPPVLEQASARLTLRAVEDGVLVEVDLLDRRAADMARLVQLL